MPTVVSAIEMDIPLPSSTGIGTIPNVTSISITPAVVDPGVSIGQRASISVTMRDVPYPLAGTSFNSGTFWGKLRAFRRSLQGLALRLIRQIDGQVITEHYVIESLSRSGGDMVTVVAKDLLKIADADRAQAPSVSHGRVLADIDAVVTEFILTPTGIGNLEYPPSGKVAIGGSEIVTFARTDDTMTIVRAQSGTVAKAHDADEIVQLVLIYTSASPAAIFYNLLTIYTEIDRTWLPLAEWQADVDVYNGRLYSAEIAVPTPVKTLLDELVEQTGLVTWWDAESQQVRLKSLRPVTGARFVGTAEMMADSFSFQEQPNKRVSEVWTFFALRNPLAKLDDPSNYRSTLVTVDPDSDVDYGNQPAIRKIFSRWIAINNRPAASRINSMQLSRYRDPPRRFSFELYITSEAPSLGQGLELAHWSLQDEDGAEITALVQVTSLERNEDHFVVDAEEMLFSDFTDPDDPDSGSSNARLIIIDSDTYNVNLRDLHDSFYVPAIAGDEILCIIENDVKVGSASTSLPSFDVGTWAAGVVITLRNEGRIQGRGGDTGTNGGTALYTRYTLTVDNRSQIYGGGGGGSGSVSLDGVLTGGGGGAGFDPGGATGFPGGPGTTESGGGSGGGPGQDGSGGGTTFPPGSAGAAIDGNSYCLFTAIGTIAGPQIN